MQVYCGIGRISQMRAIGTVRAVIWAASAPEPAPQPSLSGTELAVAVAGSIS
jgi:hypothetical protein